MANPPLATLLLFCIYFVFEVSAAQQKRNVIHVVIDDLRPELGSYGRPNTHTPNLDWIASQGTVFDRAYAQQAVCGPSRNSFMSGRRPDRSLSYNFINSFRDDHPDWWSLPGMFKEQGALALAAGKLYHPKVPPVYDGNKSWSDEALPYSNPCWNTADDPNFPFQDGGLPCVPCLVDIEHYLLGKNTSVGNDFCTTDAYEDLFSVQKAIELFQLAVDKREQFYLGVGMHKPHIPWQASQADFDLHPIESVELPKQRLPPKDVPGIALQYTDAQAKGHTSPWNPLNDQDTLNARRAYKAALTGMDRKLGMLIQAVKNSSVFNNTAWVVHSDHGWHLGELGEFRKFTNFEVATRVPFIIYAPWLHSTLSSNPRSSVFAELVDVMPTIHELAGLNPLPDSQKLDGVSLVPLLVNEKHDEIVQDQIIDESDNLSTRAALIKSQKVAAFSQYPRRVRDPSKPWEGNSIIHLDRSKFTHMGYTIRTDDWRYTEWVLWNGNISRPIWQNLTATELYDHRNETIYPTNFDVGESMNVAGQEEYSDIKQQLSKQLRDLFSNDF